MSRTACNQYNLPCKLYAAYTTSRKYALQLGKYKFCFYNYSINKDTFYFRVKPAVFDLFLSMAIAAYIAAVYAVVQVFSIFMIFPITVLF